jgi:hypothetical protein
MVSIQVDSKATIQYLYEIYRSNFEDPNRKIHLLLPTSKGLFYLDEQIERATDLLNPIVKGFLSLEDYNLPAKKNQQLLLFSVAILHDTSTSSMLSYYIHHNFHVSLPPQLQLRQDANNVDYITDNNVGHTTSLFVKYIPNQVPLDVENDFLQKHLATQIDHLVFFSNENKVDNMQCLRRERQRALEIIHQEKMTLLLASKKGKKRKLRSSKEINALAFYYFAMDEINLISRMNKLWQCFQLFEELKLTKNGRLIEAERNDHTTNLLSMHYDATVMTFDQILQKKTGPLPFSIVAIVANDNESTKNTSGFKFALHIGTRLGIKAKENRGYGLLMDFDQDFDTDNIFDTTHTGIKPNNSVHTTTKSKRKERRGLVSVLLERQEKQQQEELDHFKSQDFEWREEKDVVASMYTSSDLLLSPFFQAKWDLFVRAYREASRHVQYKQAKLDEFNSLAKIVQEISISTNENNGGVMLTQNQLTKWVENGTKFLNTLPSTSFLAHATRQLLKKEDFLKKKIKEKKKMIQLKEEQLEKWRKLQEEKELPKIPIGQQLKQEFIKQHRNSPIAFLEKTATEKIQQISKQLFQTATKQVKEISKQAQREFEIRTL